MTMLREFREPTAREAEENLRVIRDLMERSTKYSTFSGLSGVLAGLASIVGCLVTNALAHRSLPPADYRASFVAIWFVVILFALGSDYLLTKRRAATVGKLVLSRLGKQMFIAAAPGLGTGVLLTGYLFLRGLPDDIFAVWMLAYGIAVCALGLFSQREVARLGAAFLAAGAITLFLPEMYRLPMMAVTFGGFHIGYGLLMARKDGW